MFYRALVIIPGRIGPCPSAWGILIVTLPIRLPLPILARLRTLFALIFLGTVLAGCTAQLAPAYDPSIVNGITGLNQQAMLLYARVASGVPASEYKQRQDMYVQLIGQANALANLTRARPDPAGLPKFLESKVKDWANLQKLSAPTGDILTKIAAQFTTMQQADQSGGISSLEAQAFQQQFNIDIQQALTYEKALARGQPPAQP